MRKKRFGALLLGLVVLATAVPLFSAFTPSALTLDFGTGQVVMTERALQGGWYNYDAKQALTHGKNLFARALAMSEDDTFAGTFPDVVTFIDKVAPRYEIAPFDGQVNFQPHGEPRFTVTNQQNGKAIDRDRLYNDILTALKGNKFPVLRVPYQTVNPTPPADIIAGITTRATFSTRYRDNPARETNLQLALGKFDGLVVAPGEEVSFNQVVGARTAATGYQTAKIIVNGEYVDGIGGGVCQVSTTVFNAVAQAGLHITEAHHHTLPSSYVPLGHDAMVSSAADLRFVNNTGAPVYFATRCHDNQISVTIYGRDKGTGIRYQLNTDTVKTLEPRDEWDKELPAATLKDYQAHPDRYERVLLTAGTKGYTVDTYLETYQGHRRLSRKRLRRATYSPTPNRYTLREKVVEPAPLPVPIPEP